MIQLTRLNNQPLVVNSDLIKFLEQSPDTVLTLVTGEKIIVRETPEEVLKKVVAFRQSILNGLAGDLRYVSSSANPVPSAGEAERKI
ncbi:MAG: flagellar FlbD family protein [Candidatus Acidiferrum sp.]|jgi:flagellar protein FlbD